MRRLAFIVGAAALAAFAGCKTVPGADTVRKIGNAGGVATGYVLMQCDIDSEAGVAITNIVANLDACTPEEGETLQDAWLRVAQAHTDILVARGSLNAQQAAMVMSGFRLVVKGYDLLLLYHPDIAVYAELTAAAIDGFSSGLLSTYRPSETKKALSAGAPDPQVLEGLRGTREYLMMRK